MFLGQVISLVVACFWTATALFSGEATRRLGSLPANIIRMFLSIILLAVTLLIATGSPLPLYATEKAWLWLSLSGLIGYVFGDYCLFNSYLTIGSRFGQLFMTLAPPTAAVLGWMLLGERLTMLSLLAMIVTLSGISLSILSKGEKGHIRSQLPLKGVLYGIGAGVGQGAGLVLSKIGMTSYALPSDATPVMTYILPFSSTMIRAFAGLAGFTLIMLLTRQTHLLRDALHNRKGLSHISLATLFGPFLGVSLSLMAVQYTESGIASTIMALTPVLIILPHHLIYHDKIRPKEILGTVISLVGVALFFL
ncbi:MAG: DMT family transporter [Bacteroidaceae bacterium]|nr:DMT family transporter [Bacteroidaceae bacterium]